MQAMMEVLELPPGRGGGRAHDTNKGWLQGECSRNRRSGSTVVSTLVCPRTCTTHPPTQRILEEEGEA